MRRSMRMQASTNARRSGEHAFHVPQPPDKLPLFRLAHEVRQQQQRPSSGATQTGWDWATTLPTPSRSMLWKACSHLVLKGNSCSYSSWNSAAVTYPSPAPSQGGRGGWGRSPNFKAA